MQPSLEINHNGKDSQFDRTGKRAMSPSSIIASFERMNAARKGREPLATIEMTEEMIEDAIEKYAAAAYRCKQAGFEMCMIHGGHGNNFQFASPLYNKRTDKWGGSLENRTRLPLKSLTGYVNVWAKIL